MYWLHPPSLLRRVAAIALLAGAVAWDLRSDGREPYPVALVAVPAGSVIPPEAIGWVELPRGALPLVAPQGRRAAVDLAAGDPLVPAVLADGVVAPDGWWTIPIAIGSEGADISRRSTRKRDAHVPARTPSTLATSVTETGEFGSSTGIVVPSA